MTCLALGFCGMAPSGPMDTVPSGVVVAETKMVFAMTWVDLGD